MNNVTQKPRAISYSRFSSGKQGKGSSIARQEQAFLEWLGVNSEYQPHAYVDYGISAYQGRNAKRGSLAQIIDLIRMGEIKTGDALIVESMDRLSRQAVFDSFDLVREILSAGVTIITLEDGQRYDKSSLDDQRAYILIAGLQAAHQYSKRLGARVASANKAKRVKASEGIVNKVTAACWLKDGKLYEPFAGLVRNAVDLYLLGHGHRSIVMKLQERIDREPVLQAKYGKKLQATTVKRWLQSPELIGDWNSVGGLISGCFEPLISNVVYQRVQLELERRTKTPSKERTYAISGLVKCTVCKGRFHIRIQKPRVTKSEPKGSEAYEAKPPILYCNCANYLKNGNCSNKSTWPYEVLMHIYEYGLTDALAAIHMSKTRAVSTEEISELEERVAALQTQSQRSEALYSKTGKMSYLDQVDSAQRQIKLLEGKRAEIEAAAARDFTSSWDGGNTISLDYLNNLDLVPKRELLSKIGYEIEISDREASLSFGGQTGETFSLLRRSQAHKCYILKIEAVSSPDELEKPHQEYRAIDRGGNCIAKAETDKHLMAMLNGLAP